MLDELRERKARVSENNNSRHPPSQSGLSSLHLPAPLIFIFIYGSHPHAGFSRLSCLMRSVRVAGSTGFRTCTSNRAARTRSASAAWPVKTAAITFRRWGATRKRLVSSPPSVWGNFNTGDNSMKPQGGRHAQRLRADPQAVARKLCGSKATLSVSPARRVNFQPSSPAGCFRRVTAACSKAARGVARASAKRLALALHF